MRAGDGTEKVADTRAREDRPLVVRSDARVSEARAAQRGAGPALTIERSAGCAIFIAGAIRVVETPAVRGFAGPLACEEVVAAHETVDAGGLRQARGAAGAARRSGDAGIAWSAVESVQARLLTAVARRCARLAGVRAGDAGGRIRCEERARLTVFVRSTWLLVAADRGDRCPGPGQRLHLGRPHLPYLARCGRRHRGHCLVLRHPHPGRRSLSHRRRRRAKRESRA